MPLYPLLRASRLCGTHHPPALPAGDVGTWITTLFHPHRSWRHAAVEGQAPGRAVCTLVQPWEQGSEMSTRAGELL